MYTLLRNTRKIQQKKTIVNTIQFVKTTLTEHKESCESLCNNYYGIFLWLKERSQPQGHKNDTLRKPLLRTNFAKQPMKILIFSSRD